MSKQAHIAVRQMLEDAAAVLGRAAADADLHVALAQAAQTTAHAMRTGHKLLVAGNGGSAADAQHLAAEFVCRLCADRPALRAIALTTDSSALTAIGNDYGYDRIFARQVEALGQPGDVFLGISTSGNSPNILRALEMSRSLGITTIGLSGESGGAMLSLCDCMLRVPSRETMHIQEAHLALEHIFCAMVEQICFPADTVAASPTVAAGRG